MQLFPNDTLLDYIWDLLLLLQDPFFIIYAIIWKANIEFLQKVSRLLKHTAHNNFKPANIK